MDRGYAVQETFPHSDSFRFRWARLSLDNLSAQRTEKSVREALRELPGTLRETYGDILTRILRVTGNLFMKLSRGSALRNGPLPFAS